MRAKTASLISKAFAGVYTLAMVVIGTIIKGGLLSTDETTAILETGAFFFILFSPVDVSLIIQNIRGKHGTAN